MSEFRQPIACNHEPEPVPALLQGFGCAFEGEGVVDPAGWTALLALLHQVELAEDRHSTASPRPGQSRVPPNAVKRGARRILPELLDEAVRLAIRREPNRGLVGFAFFEVPHAPRVCRVD